MNPARQVAGENDWFLGDRDALRQRRKSWKIGQLVLQCGGEQSLVEALS